MQIVEKRVIYIAISVVLILAGIVGMIVNAGMGNGAFSTDVEFSGGTSIEVSIGKEFENNDITNIVKETTGENNPQVQKVGDGHSVTIKTKSLSTEVRSKLQTALSEKYDLKPENFSIQDVSATISSEMVRTSILSVVVACVFMLIYVSIRFKDFSMGASAILALCHDALIVVGSYAVLRIPLSNSFIAAILTVLGYSINATIVIFDRIRENNFEHLLIRFNLPFCLVSCLSEKAYSAYLVCASKFTKTFGFLCLAEALNFVSLCQG